MVKHVYRLCNFDNFQMPDSYVKQNCCPIRMLGDKSDIYLEISSITHVSSIRICIGTTMCYLTQFSMSGKLTKSKLSRFSPEQNSGCSCRQAFIHYCVFHQV